MYYPKGGMCARCKHAHTQDCSKLPFNTMRVIRVVGEDREVKCTEYTAVRQVK